MDKCADGAHATASTPDGADSESYTCVHCGHRYVCVACGRVEVSGPLVNCAGCGDVARAEGKGDRLISHG